MAFRIRFKKWQLLLVCFWLLFFMPLALLRTIPRMEYFSVILRLPIVLSVTVGLFKNKKSRTFFSSRIWIFIILILVWGMLCVLIHSPSLLLSYIIDAYQIVEMLIMLVYSANNHGKVGFTPLYYVSVIYIFLNFISIILFPNGMFVSDIGSLRERAQWLFGSKNNMPVYMIVFLYMVLLQKKDSLKANLLSWIPILVASYSVISAGDKRREFMSGSSTGIVICFMIIVFAIILSRVKDEGKLEFTPLSMFRVEILAVLMNVIILGGISIPAIRYIVVDLLGKTLTYSGRVYVWQNAISYILASPVTGHGYIMNEFSRAGATSTYNFFLGIMKSFGIPAVALLFLLMSSIKTSKRKDVQIALFGLFSVFVNGLMSQVDLKFPLFFITIIYLLEEHGLKSKVEAFRNK